MYSALLTCGPPASVALWSDVVQRLEGRAAAHELLAGADGSLAAVAGLLADRAARLERPRVLVAHGLAVPAALQAARLTNLDGLVLSNGPLSRLDPVSRALAASLRLGVGRALFRPTPMLRWLASSAGLRRSVVNPYVWDRDTVVTICDPLFRDREERQKTKRYLLDISHARQEGPVTRLPLLLLHGDADRLYPLADTKTFARTWPGAKVEIVPGGAHYHPLERPWAFADAVHAWSSELTMTGMS